MLFTLYKILLMGLKCTRRSKNFNSLYIREDAYDQMSGRI